MTTRAIGCLATLTCGLVGCSVEDSAPTGPGVPSLVISDARHGGGNAGFFFLPPLVPNPNTSGTFDATLSPVVEVCEWTSTCVAIVAGFTKQTGTGGALVRVDNANQHYSVNWDTKQCVSGPCTLDQSKVYRLRVSVAGTELGFADVRLVSNGAQLRNLETNEYIGLVDGRTLPVKFRIETGAVAVIGNHGGTAVFEGGKVELAFPAGATETELGVTAAPVVGGYPDMSVISGTLVEFNPSPVSFNEPVSLKLAFPSSLPQGTHADRLVICKMIGDACVPVPGSSASLATRTVLAQISTFSEYGITEFPEIARFMNFQPPGSQDPSLRWVSLLRSTGEVQLTPCCLGDFSHHISWSPDGSRYVYVTPGTSVNFITVANADGTGAVQIGSGCYSDPIWAPVGNRILFQTCGGIPSTMNADGTDPRSFPGLPHPVQMSWSPDAQRILIWPNHGPVSIVSNDGTGLIPLVLPPSLGSNSLRSLLWSPDGTRIAFSWDDYDELGLAGLWVFSLNDATLVHILRTPAYPTTATPIGWLHQSSTERIVFLRENQQYEGDRGIYTVRPDGTDESQILSGDMSNVRLSPDGRRISFCWPGGPNSAETAAYGCLYLMNIDGSGLQLYPRSEATFDIWTEWRP